MVKKIKKKLSAKTTLLLGGFLFTFLFWASTREVFSFAFKHGGEFDVLLGWIGVSLLLFVINLSWHGISSFLIEKRWVLILGYFGTQAGYLFLFGRYFLGWAAYLILVFTLWLWGFRARKDFSTRSKVLPLRSINFGLKTAITLFLIVLSFSFYLHTSNRATDEELVRSLRDFSVEIIERVFSFRLAEFDPGMSFEELIFKNAGRGILGNYLAGGVKPTQVNQVVTDTLRGKYQNRFEIKFESSDSVHSILAKIVEKRISNYFNTYSQYIPYALVAVIFLGLKLFTLVYFWLAKLGAFILFKLFLATGFVKITREEAEVEILKI